jgi:hypothetical protein
VESVDDAVDWLGGLAGTVLHLFLHAAIRRLGKRRRVATRLPRHPSAPTSIYSTGPTLQRV